jgi:hypothetical protein
LKKGLCTRTLLLIQCRCVGLPLVATNHCEQHTNGQKQQGQRSKPEQPGGGFDGRVVEDEIAVAVYQKLLDLGITFAGFDQVTRTSRRKSSARSARDPASDSF